MLVDKEAGIKLSYDSEELYNQIVEAYLEESNDYLRDLDKFLEEKNWREYGVIAHAIKGNSKQIGADALYDEALMMEKAAKAEDEEAVNIGHGDFIKHYKAVIKFIKNGFSDEPPKSKSKKKGNLVQVIDESEVKDTYLQQDLKKFIQNTYFKILRANLTTGTHDDVLLNIDAKDNEEAFSEDIGQWFASFADNGLVHPQDVEEFRRQTDIEYLKNHFAKNDEDIVVRYRRLMGESFHWVSMYICKSEEYAPDKEIVMLYIRDMEREISQDAEIYSTLFDIFQLYSEGRHHEEIINSMIESLAKFYDASKVYIYKYEGENITLPFSHVRIKTMEPLTEHWTGELGKGQQYSIDMENPRKHLGSRLVFRYASMLIYSVISEHKRREQQQEIRNQYRIVRTLASTYFCVYKVDLTNFQTTKVVSREYLDKLFGDSQSAFKLLTKMEEFLVKTEYKERLREFNQISEWMERLNEKDSISIEFDGTHNGWTQAKIIVLHRNGYGKATEVLYAVKTINEQKQRELEDQRVLKDTLEMAQRANQAKTAFLSNMSHDIRTPMNAIIGYTNLAISHLDAPEQVKDYLEHISSASDHLLSLINSVLDMSRIESGTVQLVEDKCNLVELVQDLEVIFQGSMEDKKHKFTIDTSGIQNSRVRLDKLRLNQVLINLVGNAVKYTEDGGKISLKVREIDASKDISTYEFVIKDNGIGMSEKFLKNLFIPFERERTSTVSGIQGTGLGMPITKNYVELMGGTISVESKKGKGTTFTVIIPFKTETGSDDLVEDTPQENFDHVSLNGIKVLLVEDNLVNRQIAREILTEQGIILEEAVNGKEAVDILRQKGPDYYKLILMDVQMPVMNGYEATAIIRKMKNKKLAKIPIIAMTANAFEEDKQEAIKAGMDAHVSKPFKLDVLLGTMRKLLG